MALSKCIRSFRSHFLLLHAIPSLLLARKSLQGHNTPVLRRCRSTSTADIRFVFEQFRVSCWPSLGIAPPYCSVVTVGFHRYEPVSTQELLPGDAVLSTF